MFIPSYKEIGPGAKCWGEYDPSSNWCYLCYYRNDCWIEKFKERLNLKKRKYTCKRCKEKFESYYSYKVGFYFHKMSKKEKKSC